MNGKVDILVGTQMLTKGLDLPKLGVIGLIQADSSMVLPDFSAKERTYQQISQVAGRLGRGHGHGQLFLQTYQPENLLYKWALVQDYDAFYNSELAERKAFNFPPNCYMLVIEVKRATQNGAIKSINRVRDLVSAHKDVHISQPAPSFHEKRSSSYHWQIVLKAADRSALTRVIQGLPSQVSYNIDPTDLL